MNLFKQLLLFKFSLFVCVCGGECSGTVETQSIGSPGAGFAGHCELPVMFRTECVSSTTEPSLEALTVMMHSLCGF